MNERTLCSDCGTAIDRRTFHRLDGRCVACHRKHRGFTPDDFQLPANLIERLVALNKDPAYYRHVAWEHGIDFLKYCIEDLQQRHASYRTWLPRLRAFADDCRITRPLPDETSLSLAEREQQRIYGQTMERERPGSEERVALCRMPLIAMPVARRLWQGREESTVLLTPDEAERWNAMCLNSEEIHWLFDHCWWIIDDAPQQEFAVPPGEQAWILDWGECGHPRAGRGYNDLWAWDGTRARFVENCGAWIS